MENSSDIKPKKERLEWESVTKKVIFFCRNCAFKEKQLCYSSSKASQFESVLGQLRKFGRLSSGVHGKERYGPRVPKQGETIEVTQTGRATMLWLS
jgi:hypothetical protein